MSNAATTAALAALRYWAAQAGAVEAVWDSPEQHDLIRHAARLVKGEPAAGNGWPAINLSQPLESIFSRITPKGEGQQAPTSYVRRASLALSEEVLFPAASSAEAAQPAGDGPIDALRGAIAGSSRETPEVELETLLYALQRHAWCLPSPLDAVSLYDFARTHAAVAAALAAQGNSDGDLFLLGGDLSGVQSFIYTLTAAGATRQLRGRSFYLQLLTEACAHFVLNGAGLPLTNLLYAGGGRFYVLLPGLVDGMPAADWVRDQRAALDTFFLNRHQGELYLALDGEVVQQADLCDQDSFRALWRGTTEAINRVKRRRFADAGLPLLERLFAPQGHGGNEDAACAVCGYQGEVSDFARPDPDDNLRRCKLCRSFEDLGRLLHKAEWLLLSHLDRGAAPADWEQARRQGWQATLAELGLHVQLLGPRTHLGERGHDQPTVRYTTALALDVADLGEPPPLPEPVVCGFRPVANTTPTMTEADMEDWKKIREPDEPKPKIDSVKPFNVMVAQSRGVKRLGVLRMDVDDLGDLFRYRLDSGLARVSALSAALALFFEGRVGRLCDDFNDPAWRRQEGIAADDEPDRGSVYCIYSGGDDLFIVGSWHLLPHLARRISDDLARYSGQNPYVHLSAGISLHGAKFPLYQAAEAAHEELERAKDREGKAALGFLEQVVAWEYADTLFDLVDKLDGYLREPTRLPRAILQTLQQLYVQYDAGITERRRRKRSGQFRYDPWVWRSMYQLTRIAKQVRGDDDEKAIREWVCDLRDNMLQGIDLPVNTGGRAIERVGLAARWTQLLIRKERDNGTRE